MRVSLIDPSLFTLPYDQDLADGLRHGGHQVMLYGRRPTEEEGGPGRTKVVEAFYRVADNPRLRRLPNRLRLALKGIDHIWSMSRLPRRLLRARPDIIHFQWLPVPLIDRQLLRRLRRVAPLVLTVHDTNPFNGAPSARLQSHGLRSCLGGFDRLIVHTTQSRAALVQQGVSPERIAIIPHGLSPTTTEIADDRMEGTIEFVLFGKLKPYKGADLLLEGYAALPASLRRRARVRIIGKPYMDVAPLFALVQRHGIAGSVQIEARYVPDEEVPDIYGPGTVAVFPYRGIDASGMMFVAISHGRPMIASRAGTFLELLQPGVHGLTTPPGDVPALTAALARMIEDRDFVRRCAGAVRELRQQATSWEAAAASTAALYEDVLSSGSSHATEVMSSTRKTIGANC